MQQVLDCYICELNRAHIHNQTDAAAWLFFFFFFADADLE